MKTITQALTFRVVVCAAISVVITGLATQSIVRLAAEPRNDAGTMLVAQSDAWPAGSITVAQAR